jgi:hypothetical protein
LVLTGISAIWFGFTTVVAFIHGLQIGEIREIEEIRKVRDIEDKGINGLHDHQSNSIFANIYGRYLGLAVVIQSLIYVFWIISEILSIVGAVKNNKCLLVPFMACLALQMLICVGFIVFVGWLFGQAGAFTFAFIYIIPLLVALGISIYFLAITIKFHKELSSGRNDGVQPGMVLPPYTIPQGGVATNVHGYVPAYGPQGQVQKMGIP